MTSPFSDYIVYVDESGDHSLESINPEYPLFVLSFCIFRKDAYASTMTPAVRKLKFETFGHDMVVLHEIDIRKKKGGFAKLGKEAREVFLNRLTDIIQAEDFKLVAVVIDKNKLKARYSNPGHPGQDDRLTHLVCEARGAKEDAELELEFRRIRDGSNYFHKPLPFELMIADKKTNSEGMQLADLTARPIGLSVLRPDQKNRALAVLEDKFCRGETGRKDGVGLKIFP
jgi:hypothetical protein